ncbi:MAG: 4Fe-4S dicluster domain-containing protein [Actinomycetia bacterium]|nr:4Fe-4S dicluster domain-containing protein [Actinomycetes bacterium]
MRKRDDQQTKAYESHSLKRRDFLKAALATGAVGLGGAALLRFISPADTEAADWGSPNALGAKHWGLVIDVEKLNRFANFSQIIEACHAHHNVPAVNDPKTEVKWIWQDDFEHCFEELDNAYLSEDIKAQEFLVLCNHCENPSCVRVCPTQATFKRDDGIVCMDYHRCIGCRFCMTGCPYNARSLNFFDPRPYIKEIDPDYPTRTQGVVEKCTLCVERIDQGLPPYCVEASNGAIVFGDLADPESDVRQALQSGLSIRRKAELGAGPSVYYLIGGGVPAVAGGELNA